MYMLVMLPSTVYASTTPGVCDHGSVGTSHSALPSASPGKLPAVARSVHQPPFSHKGCPQDKRIAGLQICCLKSMDGLTMYGPPPCSCGDPVWQNRGKTSLCSVDASRGVSRTACTWSVTAPHLLLALSTSCSIVMSM